MKVISNNRMWMIFLAVMAVMALWFTGKASSQWHQYIVQNAHTIPLDLQWSIKEQSHDRYFLHVAYSYEVQGKTYAGETDVIDGVLKSPEAAQQMVFRNSNKQWPVWYHSQHPEQSTVVKHYPLKLTIYAVILWAILIYFVWLGFFVKTQVPHFERGD